MNKNIKNIQLINKEGIFCNDLNNAIKSWKLYNQKCDYQIVAILGPQSSGKSTLLNNIFETNFDEMIATKGRYQCTRGIWLSKSRFDNTLVVDVEGTDSRERVITGLLSFEKKLSLFSLAIADVFVINMWYHDIGRYNAAGMDILNTIFELNLQIFQNNSIRNSKKKILFVFRDYTDDTPLNELENIIINDTKNIWNKIYKPSEYKNSSINDFFEFQFYSMPHKNFSKNKFDTKINQLKKTFKKNKMKSSVPIDGLNIYLSNIWKTIKNNKDLNLPSQREMVAVYRCEEISISVFHQFSLKLNDYKKLQNDEIIDNFRDISKILLNDTIKKYCNESIIYDGKIRDNTKNKLYDKCIENIKDVWYSQIKLLNNMYIKKFKNNLNDKSKNSYKNFNKITTELKTIIVNDYIKNINKLTLDNYESHKNTEIKYVSNQINNLIDDKRTHQSKLILDEAKKMIISINLKNILDSAQDNMWAKIRETYNIKIEEIDKIIITYLRNIGASKESTDMYIQNFHTIKLNIIKDKIITHIKKLSYHMEKRFNNLFKFKNGKPRVWSHNDSIESVYEHAIKNTIKLVNLFAVFRLDESYDNNKNDNKNIPNNLILIDSSQCDNIIDMFKQYANMVYIQIVQEQNNDGSKLFIPKFIWFAMLFLGFNEIMWIASRPLLLIMLLTIFCVIYIISQVHGGIIKISEDYFNTWINQIKESLFDLVYLNITKKDIDTNIEIDDEK